jgi:predicted transposase YdaD
VIERMKRRVVRDVPPAEAANLWTATLVLLGLRYPRDFVTQLLSGVRAMKDSVTYQAIVEEGKAAGRAEGIAKGKIEGAREILLDLGRERFGPPDAATRAALEALTDLDRLRALSKRLFQADTWQELVAAPEPRKRRRKNSSRD